MRVAHLKRIVKLGHFDCVVHEAPGMKSWPLSLRTYGNRNAGCTPTTDTGSVYRVALGLREKR
ncbi:hypothetical protein V1294_006834 [Bradyrhizobium sp. AZCC 1678]